MTSPPTVRRFSDVRPTAAWALVLAAIVIATVVLILLVPGAQTKWIVALIGAVAVVAIAAVGFAVARPREIPPRAQ